MGQRTGETEDSDHFAAKCWCGVVEEGFDCNLDPPPPVVDIQLGSGACLMRAGVSCLIMAQYTARAAWRGLGNGRFNDRIDGAGRRRRSSGSSDHLPFNIREVKSEASLCG